ncbi:MAG: hypothetical protein ABIQ30_13760 [Devosia sp.]
MLDTKTYRRIVRASALYDLVVTVPFVTPWSFGLVAAAVGLADTGLGLPGIVPLPDVLTVLLANLLGSVVVVWSIVRLRLVLLVLGRYDAVARGLFAIWQVNALAHGMSWAIVPLLMFEIGFGVLQALPVKDGD